VIENHWKFKMAEGPLVSVQDCSTAARTLTTRARQLRGCPPPHGHAAARAQAACVRRGRSNLRAARAGRSYSSFPHLTQRRFALLHLRRAHHTGELLHPPIPSQFTTAAAPSHHSYLSSCAGSLGEAQNRHPAASLSAPMVVTG
jgi:hypothetical protein